MLDSAIVHTDLVEQPGGQCAQQLSFFKRECFEHKSNAGNGLCANRKETATEIEDVNILYMTFDTLVVYCLLCGEV